MESSNVTRQINYSLCKFHSPQINFIPEVVYKNKQAKDLEPVGIFPTSGGDS